jgi:hypothetical protein
MESKRRIRTVGRGLRVGTVLPLATTMRLYLGTDKLVHGYAPGYASYLRTKRWQVKRVLEIGVGGYESRAPGGSLRIWRDYFPRARIVGMDINDKDVDLGPRVRFVRGDQSSAEDLERVVAALGGPPDVVIDDGSHLGGHAKLSFEYLFPRMSSGSLYVVEDLHTSYWPEYGGDVPAPPDTAVGFVKALVDGVQAEDPTFPDMPVALRPEAEPAGVESMDIRPGLVFITKR